MDRNIVKMLLIVISLFGISTFAAGKKTLHQTKDGRYPAYFVDKPGDKPWDEEKQAKYDAKVDEQIDNYCVNSQWIKREQENIANEKKVGEQTGYVNAASIHKSGAVIVELRPGVEAAIYAVKDLTGKPITSYGCPED